MHLNDKGMAKANEREDKEIDEDLLNLIQDIDEDIDDSLDPIPDWEQTIEISILKDALQYESDVEDFWGKLPRIWPSI